MSTIITRNSATSGSVPSSLVQGELAINVKDGRLFYGSGSGNVVKEFIASGSGGGTFNTGSFVTTSSFNAYTGSNTSQFAGTASYTTNALSASFASTASYVKNAISASYASTASIALQVSTSISTQNLQHNVLFVDTSGPGTIQVDGGLRYNPNQDLLTTTSSYAIQALSSSFAVTASYATNALSASFATSASYATNALTASFAVTASYVKNAISASYAPPTFPYTGSALITGSLGITGSLSNGSGNIASGIFSHAEGQNTNSLGSYSHAEGRGTIASGSYSHAEGSGTTATGDYSHAEGQSTTSTGNTSHAEGYSTTATGNYSHAEGQSTTSTGNASHAEGDTTTANNDFAHSEGAGTTAAGVSSHAEGINTTSSGSYSHAEGYNSYSIGLYSHAEGNYTVSTGDYSHTEGTNTNTIGIGSHAEGDTTTSTGDFSHAEGYGTTATGDYSHAEGANTNSHGDYSHAEGNTTTATGDYSHAEGANTNSYGDGSHAEGLNTTAGQLGYHPLDKIISGVFELDPGYQDLTSLFTPGVFILIDDILGGINGTPNIFKLEVASSTYNGTPATEITLVDTSINISTNKYTVGIYNVYNPTLADASIGSYSHTSGESTHTIGIGSSTEGYFNEALGYYQSVVGIYNEPINDYGAFIIGGGYDNTPRNLLVASPKNQIVTITGSATTYKPLTTQENISAAFTVSGEIVEGVSIHAGVTLYDLVSLDNGGDWIITNQTQSLSEQLLGIYIGDNKVLLEGYLTFTDTTGDGPLVGGGVREGQVVYIQQSSSGLMSADIPSSFYVRTLGHVLYHNVNNAANWTMKFNPSNDWITI